MKCKFWENIKYVEKITVICIWPGPYKKYLKSWKLQNVGAWNWDFAVFTSQHSITSQKTSVFTKTTKKLRSQNRKLQLYFW